MRKVFMAVMVLAFIMVFAGIGHCEDYEQSESQMGSSLDREISSDSAQGQAEMSGADSEQATGTGIGM